MKKTLFALLIACLFVVLFVGCSAEPEEQQKTTYVMKVKVEVTGTHSAWSNTYYSKGSVLSESKSAKKADETVKYELFTDEACTQKVTDKDNPFVSYYFAKDGDKYSIAFGDSVKMKFNSTMTVSGTDITLAKDTTYTLTESKDGDQYSVTITVPENLTAKLNTLEKTYTMKLTVSTTGTDAEGLVGTYYSDGSSSTDNETEYILYTDEECKTKSTNYMSVYRFKDDEGTKFIGLGVGSFSLQFSDITITGKDVSIAAKDGGYSLTTQLDSGTYTFKFEFPKNFTAKLFEGEKAYNMKVTFQF